jgi:hypothetical protein
MIGEAHLTGGGNMGKGLGMRGKDLQKFLMVARDHNVIILVRHTNEAALKYIGQPGFYPKPAVCKAKTAHDNPRPIGATTLRRYDIAGLVVHPAFHPTCYEGAKLAKAQKYWDDTMKVLSPTMVHRHVDPYDKQSSAPWGVERHGVGAASRWSWRVDIDPNSQRFGCLQLKSRDVGWSYIHGDYDLKDVIVEGWRETNITHKKKIDGVPNNVPFLFTVPFEVIQAKLNALIGADMVQHGAEAQFAWHGDEPITVAYPDWTHQLLYDAVTVQSWYTAQNRKVHAKMGPDTNWVGMRSRMFHFGPNGMFAPGAQPNSSWG